MKARKTFPFLIIFGVLALGYIAMVNFTPTGAQATGTLADVQARGYLIVGSDTTYAPFESINSETQLAEGFDVDIAHQICLALGVNLVYQTNDWSTIIPDLQAKKFDIIISAMTITAEREVEVDFTRWYFKSEQAILVLNANPKNINTEADLNTTDGLIIGVQSSTTSHWYVDDELDENKVTLLTYDSVPLAIEALKNGQVDVVLGDYGVLILDELQSAETEVVDTFSPEDFGIACRTGDDDLREAINDAIDGLLGSNPDTPVVSDLYNIIYYKWFGIDTDFGPDITGYTGTVTTGTIPSAALGAPAPGFEITVIFLAIGIISVAVAIRRKRK